MNNDYGTGNFPSFIGNVMLDQRLLGYIPISIYIPSELDDSEDIMIDSNEELDGFLNEYIQRGCK